MRIVLLMVVLSTCGCGTLANIGHSEYLFLHSGDKPVRVYGGVRNDFDYVAKMVKSPINNDGDSNTDVESQKAPIVTEPSAAIPVAYFAVIDPVLSFVGDTVTLPRVLREQRAVPLGGVQESVGSRLPE